MLLDVGSFLFLFSSSSSLSCFIASVTAFAKFVPALLLFFVLEFVRRRVSQQTSLFVASFDRRARDQRVNIL